VQRSLCDLRNAAVRQKAVDPRHCLTLGDDIAGAAWPSHSAHAAVAKATLCGTTRQMHRSLDGTGRPHRFVARLVAIVVLAVPAVLWVWAMARFYRRFVYHDAQGTVWGLADDVYISACFGRSLVSGDGFVWYAGAPRVEGISNPLWSVVIGALHKLPGFTEDRLGLFVICLNGVVLAAIVLVFARATIEAMEERSKSVPVRLWACAGATVFLPCSLALSYWSAEGFEVAFLALVTFVAILCALRPRTRTTCMVLGLLMLAGIATRMDFVVLAAPVLVVATAHSRGSRVLLAWTAVVAVLGILLLFLARRSYYGDWLPNTYYLKTTGWKLSARLQRGLDQNRRLLILAVVAWLPLLLPIVRRSLGNALPYAAAGWLAFGATVAYSTYVGGDAWRLFAGYDRHTVVGGVLLAWGNSVLFGAARQASTRFAFAVWGVVLGASATLAQDGSKQLQDGLLAETSPVRQYEWDWIRYGKQFREVSEPGARVAICPAGAIVYFSHRGGVDLLGKVEPLVAHLNVSPQRDERAACWRDAPGHNKGDDVRVFELRKPEFARGRLPAEQKERYFKFKYRGTIFFVRKDTTLFRNPLP
jgi:arabinofuranosyltransferase